jgi:hypothetical protein
MLDETNLGFYRSTEAKDLTLKKVKIGKDISLTDRGGT